LVLKQDVSSTFGLLFNWRMKLDGNWLRLIGAAS
jgi:hypothetical protein